MPNRFRLYILRVVIFHKAHNTYDGTESDKHNDELIIFSIYGPTELYIKLESI